MQGTLGPGVVPALLRQVYAEGKTGTLRFERGDEHCTFRLVRGHIFRAAASAEKVHMGEIMVARGMLSAEDLTRATEIVRREHRLLGDVLKGIGAIDQHVLEDALVLHVIEVLAEVLKWREGRYVFEERQAETFLEEADYPLKLSTGSMILEAVALIEDRECVRFALGDMDRVLALCSDVRLRFQRVDIAPIDGFVLSRVDGALSAREIIAVTPMPEEAVEKSLFALLATGIIEPGPQSEKRPPLSASVRAARQEILSAYEALSTQNHFEVLGVSRHVTPEELKAAYYRLARRFHPDIHHDPALASMREQIEAIFTRINVAFDVLSHAYTRAVYEASLGPAPPPEPRRVVEPPAPAPPPAPTPAAKPGPNAKPAPSAPAAPAPAPEWKPEEILARAEKCLEDGRQWEAIDMLGHAIPLADPHLRPRARVLLAQAHLKNPDSTRLAEQELLTAHKEDPRNAEACYLLAGLYRSAGLTARAKGMLRKTLKLEPGHRKAAADLEALEPRKEGD